MKLITLTQGKFAQVDDADFDWLNQWNWYANKIKGTWYAFRGTRGPTVAPGDYGRVERVAMHRVVSGAVGRWEIVDHIDGNGLNNQWGNLRICTTKENLQNTKRHRNIVKVTSEELAAWDYYRQHGDLKRLAKIMGVSLPTVSNIISTGKGSAERTEYIKKFYADRAKEVSRFIQKDTAA